MVVEGWGILDGISPPGASNADNFNRSDATTIGTASDSGTAVDGGTWTADPVAGGSAIQVGIKSNAAYFIQPGAAASGRERRNLGTVSADVKFTINAVSFSRGVLWCAYDPTTDSGYTWLYNGTVSRLSGGSLTTLGTPVSTYDTSVYNHPISAITVRMQYNSSTGVITVTYSGGFTGSGTVTDGTPLTGTGNTWCGFSATQAYYIGGGTSGTVNTGETFDDYSATQVGTPVSGVGSIESWD